MRFVTDRIVEVLKMEVLLKMEEDIDSVVLHTLGGTLQSVLPSRAYQVFRSRVAYVQTTADKWVVSQTSVLANYDDRVVTVGFVLVSWLTRLWFAWAICSILGSCACWFVCLQAALLCIKSVALPPLRTTARVQGRALPLEIIQLIMKRTDMERFVNL
jgi:hypothetical protein